VNYVTLSSLSAGAGWWQMPTLWSGRIATVALGAPIGSYGDWQIRGAMSSGDVPSWTFAGEYRARDTRDHAFTAGLSFSAQALAAAPATPAIAPGDGRRVGSAYGSDRWRIVPRVDLEYGLRFDRYDYVSEPELLSPRVAARVNPGGRTFLRVSAGRRTIAPGADEFLPPPDSTMWLPPQRTFSPLVGFDLHAERVDSYAFAVEQEFGDANRMSTISVRRFRQQSADQMATLFGLDRKSDGAHYYVSTVGDVDLDGWGVAITGRLAPHVRGTVDYSISDARWDRGVDRAFLASLAPSLTRSPIERIHDLCATLETNLAPTSTGIVFSVRLNSAFSRVETVHARPIADGRFDLSVHQPLPYQPFRGGRLEMVFGLRTLSRDLAEVGSVYDELLTTAPPMRVTGGVRVRF
jgi:outer membrane receptor protein involved in Fe transport